jgi:hypothetical protein
MMKKLLFLLLLIPAPAFAGQPFKYQTTCTLDSHNVLTEDVCTVVEVRERGGALKSRNIYSNRLSLTIKSYFNKNNAFMTWDSYNKMEYPWEYKIDSVKGTLVMPGVYLKEVSWD